MTELFTQSEEQYHKLALYTLQHDAGTQLFIHQYIVDAYAAQNATPEMKPITIAFALAGLYLHLEKGYTGKQVQDAHIQMAQQKREWPTFELPEDRGAIADADVLKAPEGAERDEMINKWSASVWDSWKGSHEKVKAFLAEYDLA